MKMNTTKNIYLSIADHQVCIDVCNFKSDICIGAYCRNFLTDNFADINLTIKCFSGLPNLNLTEEFCLFNAEELNDAGFENKWGVYKQNQNIYISAVLPQNGSVILHLVSESEMHLFFEKESLLIDPFLPPLGPLIYYYLASFNKGFLLHASGVADNNHGYIFTGVSGIGKSTMANLWKDNGAQVIHDDRLFIRKNKEEFFFYNTPLYDDDTPKSAPINAVFILSQSKENTIKKINGAIAASKILANCIQHPYDEKLISSLLDTVSKLSLSVPVYELGFYPDSKIIDFIKEHIG
ncbi:MAG: hypothetical protein A2275_16915 [Bacteroidetes bacterium RIFOXYA12_FULL_35_11]|nr:MAG: hypothetical protein A2X01_17030 [Bacteroidetes bacterium GWF2_35_48]OFY83465.1 MAG: hypothetical protein A2275_16915 [Bacteroidetes bacterium RIFOXYA12_FULL_35_11]HBX53357.1 hypothetical protein [Bacteroidales bacterium]